MLAAVGFAQGGIIDDGANDADHQTLAIQPQYDAVGMAKRLNNQSQLVIDSSGILIDPLWVLAAAHTQVVHVPTGATFEIGGEVRNIVETIRHPNYTIIPGDTAASIALGWDIALIKLDAPITTVTPAELYTGTSASLIGEQLVYTGYGKSGTGSTGATIAAGTKRAGDNVGDQLGFTLNPGPSEVEYSDQILFADMDDPPGGLPYDNPLGSNTPINLEYLIALGDSGGGLFVEQGGQHYVAGIHSIVFDYGLTGTFGYGDVMGSTTIEQALSWIISTITAVPIVGDLDGDGYVGLGDIDIVLGNWNQFVTAGDLLAGDPSNDGFVGLEDLDIILGNWNAGTPPSLSGLGSLVPEPTTLVLLGIGCGVLLRRRA